MSVAEGRTTFGGTHVPNSSFLFVVNYFSGEYEIAVVDYTQNPGEELLRTYTAPVIPKIMRGLNELKYVILSYYSPGLDFRNEYNTRMWFQEENTSGIKEMDVSLDDNLLIYFDTDNNLVILTARNLTPPTVACNYYKQVRVNDNCVDCFESEQFLQSTSACDGTTNDGHNRFVDMKFTKGDTETSSETGKKRYSIKF